MKRRNFLRHSLHAAAIPTLANTLGFSANMQKWAAYLRMASASDRVLVLIYLQGGNDGLNTLIPLDQFSRLQQARPHVILPESQLISLPQSESALHPEMQDLAALYRESRFMAVQNVGYPNQNFSHFRSTDIWMSASNADEHLQDGWAGRYLDHAFPGYPEDYPNDLMPDPLAVELGYGSSLLLQGPLSTMGMTINDPESFYELIDNIITPAPDNLAGDKLEFVRLIARQSQQYGQIVAEAAKKINRQEYYPETRLAQQLKVVSRLIAGGLQTPVYLVRLGGFDTHDSQVVGSDHTRGEHADLLKTVNDAVLAFIKDLEFQGTADRVLGMTFSEFGRRIVSNASLGTDHGSAAPLFLFGNAVRGGVTGPNPNIPQGVTYKDNLAISFDFRQIYASVLEQWFELSSSDRLAILGQDFETIPLIGEPVILDAGEELAATIELYPNPCRDYARLRIPALRDKLIIEVHDVQGRMVDQIYRGKPSHDLDLTWSTSHYNAGAYFIRIKGKNLGTTLSLIKL